MESITRQFDQQGRGSLCASVDMVLIRHAVRTYVFAPLVQGGGCKFSSRNWKGSQRYHIEPALSKDAYRRLIPLSSCHGIFVAPNTSTPVSSWPTPFICTKNSVLIRREPSDSDSLRVPARESISSINMIAGFCSRAISKSCFTSLTR